MLAKIVAHGRDRTEAFERLTAALDQTLVLGVVTNLRFLRWLVRQPVVLAGEARTDTLDRIWPPDDWAARAAVPDDAWQAAAIALRPDTVADPWAGGWRLNGPSSIRLEAGGATRPVGATAPSEPFESVVVAGTAHVDIGGRSDPFRLAAPPDVDRAARAAASHATQGGSADVVAPMPGAVLTVHVAVGAVVTAGDPIVTLEAMKMEHVVAAPIDGTVGGSARPPGRAGRPRPVARHHRVLTCRLRVRSTSFDTGGSNGPPD